MYKVGRVCFLLFIPLNNREPLPSGWPDKDSDCVSMGAHMCEVSNRLYMKSVLV